MKWKVTIREAFEYDETVEAADVATAASLTKDAGKIGAHLEDKFATATGSMAGIRNGGGPKIIRIMEAEGA